MVNVTVRPSGLGPSVACHIVDVEVDPETGKVDILPGGTDTPLKEIRSVPFVTTGGDWQEISVLNSQSGPLGVVRLYLPSDKQPVQVDWIELVSAGRYKRRDF